MYSQLVLFLIYIATGILIGIIFDIFRSLRKSIKTKNVITYIQDFIFWIIVGYILIIEISRFNYGELRFYILVGLLFGLIFYIFTISKLFIKINVCILNFIKKLFYPLIKAFKKLIKFFKTKFDKFYKKSIYKNKKN